MPTSVARALKSATLNFTGIALAGCADDFAVVVPEAQPTAASYYARGRYDYKLSARLFYTAGVGWERNRFAGIDSRWIGDTGVGYIFLNNDRTSFRAAVGVTWTDEQDTAEDGRKTSFVGARLGWDFQQKVFESTTFTHTLVADENLQDTVDLRVDAQFGLQDVEGRQGPYGHLLADLVKELLRYPVAFPEVALSVVTVIGATTPIRPTASRRRWPRPCRRCLPSPLLRPRC